jgi:hypothetical protein
VRTATEKCVPKTSFQDRVSLIRKGNECKLLPKLGRFDATLSVTLQLELAEHVKELESKFIEFNRKEFLKLAFDLAEALGTDHRFNNQKKCAGKDFYCSFMKRNPFYK